MAFKMFVDEKVDVAIIETGIGGEYDCTTILRYVSFFFKYLFKKKKFIFLRNN